MEVLKSFIFHGITGTRGGNVDIPAQYRAEAIEMGLVEDGKDDRHGQPGRGDTASADPVRDSGKRKSKKSSAGDSGKNSGTAKGDVTQGAAEEIQPQLES